MANRNSFPTTLQQAIMYFADYENCHRLLSDIRWPDGKVKCPQCGSDHVTYLAKARVWKCYEKHSLAKFSLKTGTIFEDSPISLDKWLIAFWLVVNCKNGVSSCEVARSLGVTQKTAWFMDHRIRLAITQGGFEQKMGGEGGTVEVDETFIGGLARNMHKDRRDRTIKGTGGAGKVAVFGLLDRHGNDGRSRVRARVVPDRLRSTLQPIIKDNVEPNSNVYTDEHGAYQGLSNEEFIHAFVKHAEYYVDGAVHTNGIENFWSLLKRGIKGTYVSVEPFHMFRYLDEQAFRFNERFGNDGDRFLSALTGVVGKRLTYQKLIGNPEGNSRAAAERKAEELGFI